MEMMKFCQKNFGMAQKQPNFNNLTINNLKNIYYKDKIYFII